MSKITANFSLINCWCDISERWLSKHTRGFASLTSSRFFSRHSQTTTTWRRQEVTAAVSVRLSVCVRADDDELHSTRLHLTFILKWCPEDQTSCCVSVKQTKCSKVSAHSWSVASGFNCFLLKLTIIHLSRWNLVRPQIINLIGLRSITRTLYLGFIT